MLHSVAETVTKARSMTDWSWRRGTLRRLGPDERLQSQISRRGTKGKPK